MATDVIIPALGESITEATVGQWLKQPGEAVAADEPIVSLETDKVAVEVPSPVAGVLTAQAFKVGDTVAVGAVIAQIEAGAAGAAQPEEKELAPAPIAYSTVGHSSLDDLTGFRLDQPRGKSIAVLEGRRGRLSHSQAGIHRAWECGTRDLVHAETQ